MKYRYLGRYLIIGSIVSFVISIIFAGVPLLLIGDDPGRRVYFQLLKIFIQIYLLSLSPFVLLGLVFEIYFKSKNK